jgi:hypothetical protein
MAGHDRLIRVLLLAMACIFALGIRPMAAAPVKREILALYHGGKEPTATDTMLHRRAEMAANHLGYIFIYHDLRAPLPPPGEVKARYAAVMSWFTYDLDRPSDYLAWAAEVAEHGTRFVMFGGTGAALTPHNLTLLNRVLAPIGLRYEPRYVEITAGTTIRIADTAVIGFEHPLDPVLPAYPIVRLISPETRVALEVEAPVLEKRERSVLVATGPGGGMVVGGFDIYFDPVLNRAQWLVDPFEFLHRALGEVRFPIPDTTTLSGRRIYFSHVDGDGWNNLSEFAGLGGRRATSAEVMLEQLVRPYPDLPVSIGLVAGDIDARRGGDPEAALLAQRLFALPQVEVASHTFTHPFDWEFFENYDAAREAALVAGVQPPAAKGLGHRLSELLGMEVKAHDEGPGHGAAGSDALPRAYTGESFDLAQEVYGALAEAERLAPAGKKAALYNWSGDTRPFEAAIAATRRAGVRNINGGDTRLDDEYPSVGYVAPIARTAGNERQIYAVNSNENTYTDLWTNHFHHFRALRDTLERTEWPRRLKGANLYYHVYSAEKTVSLAAVRGHLDWARETALTPIRASHYAAIADGFFSTRIDEDGALRWRVSNRDGLQTLRFDEADDLEADLAESDGVMGSARHAGSLYLALDPDVPDARVVLSDRRSVTTTADMHAASLAEARWVLAEFRRGACGLTFSSTGYGAGDMSFEHVPPGRYEIEASDGGGILWRGTAEARDDQRLAFSIKASAIEPVGIRVACADTAVEP